MQKTGVPQTSLVMASLNQLICLHPGLNTVDQAPAVAAEVLVDLLFKDFHWLAQQLHHGLNHSDQGHLIVATAVLIALLQTPVTVKASLVVVRLIN